MLPQYSRVLLITDRYAQAGVGRGMLGYVIEVYGDGNYEVEFSDPSGVTIAQLVISGADLVLAPERPDSSGAP